MERAGRRRASRGAIPGAHYESMNLFRKHLVVLALAFLAIFGSAFAGDSPAPFLDRPLPTEVLARLHPVSAPDPDHPGKSVASPMIAVPSFAAAIDLLQKLSGKKVVLDKDLGTWPGAEQEQVWGVSMGFAKDEKVRDLFERICQFAGLTWKYDPASETLFASPEWKREDPRGAQELIRLIEQKPPMRSEQLGTAAEPNRVGGHSPLLDGWRIAFDALLSKPGNYASAGTLRVYHDTHGHVYFGAFPVQNDFAGTIRDARGGQAIVVLNEQESMSNKDSAGDLAYYLFDENGQFLAGGVYAVADGAESGIVKVSSEDHRSIDVDVGYGSFKLNPDHLHLGLVDGDLVLLGSTDHTGKERNAEGTRQTLCSFAKMMQLKFHIAAQPRSPSSTHQP